MPSATQQTRQDYLPDVVRVLFIGESPPAGGTFFYYANSNLYRATYEGLAAGELGAADGNFRRCFQHAGCYLEDLALHVSRALELSGHASAERQKLPFPISRPRCGDACRTAQRARSSTLSSGDRHENRQPSGALHLQLHDLHCLALEHADVELRLLAGPRRELDRNLPARDATGAAIAFELTAEHLRLCRRWARLDGVGLRA